MENQGTGPALPSEECRVPPHSGWSELEMWVWQEVGSGRIANINEKLGRTADPKKPEDWGAERRLRPSFLEAILLHNPWRSAIPRQGVRLEGVWLDESLQLSHALISCMLWFRRSRLDAEVRLVGSELSAPLIFHEAYVSGSFCMDAAKVHGPLLLRNSTFSELDLKNSQLDGQISLQQSTVRELFVLHGAHVGGSVIMRAYETTEYIYPGMGTAAFKHLDFIGSRIDRDLNLQGASITGKIRMERVVIGGDVFFRDTYFECEVELPHASIRGSVDLRGAQIKKIDLTGTQIGRELRLAVSKRSPNWADRARLDLYNAHADAIVDEPSPAVWPPELGLDGFSYTRFGGRRYEGSEGVAERTPKWFIDWLARGKPFTPQPYRQCAQVLREMGHPEMAGDVLYAGRERERKEAWRSGNNPRGTGLTLLKWFIGYGYGQRYFRSLWWVAGMVALGTLFLFVSGQIDKIGGGTLLAAAFYSFDLLLPVVELYRPHYEIALDGFAKYYFAGHKLMGYVLASFLIAGLAGLTK